MVTAELIKKKHTRTSVVKPVCYIIVTVNRCENINRGVNDCYGVFLAKLDTSSVRGSR